MKMLAQSINYSINYAKIREWGNLIAIIGSTQVIVQVISFTCGILIIRLLPTQEYALYTLANTMLGTMVVLADGGIANSVLAQGGRVWKNREELGTVLITGYELRKKFAIASLIIALPILLYLLRHHNAGWLTSILIIGSLIPAFLTTLSGNLLSIGPSLHQAILPLQKINVGISVRRLIILFLTLFFFPLAYVAIIPAGFSQIWGNIQLRKISTGFADWKQKPNLAIQKEILTVVKRILPGSIFYCLSGQITIWLISIIGSTAAVAQIGALGRISMMLSIGGSIFGSLIVPRFARLTNNRKLLFKRFIQIQLLLIGLFACIILFVSMLPSQILWILGDNYHGLEKELVLSITSSCISLFAGFLFTITTSRNWAINPFISIPFTLAVIVFGAIYINISSLSGILKFNLFVSSAEVIMYFIYCISKINKIL